MYLVLPQLANAGAAVRALGNADWWWVVAAIPAIFVAQAFSTLLLRGTIPAELPFGPTYITQFGGSFLNRVTPNNVGGMALNFRYLQKAGVDTGAATGSVGLQTVAGKAAELLLVAVFFTRTGHHTSVHFGVHSRQWLLLVISAVLAAGALLGLTPRGRRFFHDKIWGFLRSAGTTIAEVAKSPRQIALIGVGSLGGPLVQIVGAGPVRPRPGRQPAPGPGRGGLPGRPPRRQRRARARRTRCPRSRSHCRVVRSGDARQGRRLRGVDLPVVDLLVDHPGRLDRSQDRRRQKGARLIDLTHLKATPQPCPVPCPRRC